MIVTSLVRPRTAGALLALSLVVSSSSGAYALGSPADVAAAQGLYDDARTLMKSGNYATACPKLEESERLDKSLSTEFHLADCYEHVGKTASAWALFLSVASESRSQGRTDGEQVARDRAASLAPKVAHLSVNVAAASQVDGLALERDGEALGQGQWNTAVPIDAGKHAIVATAPGHADWSTTIDVVDGKAATVDVPPLTAAGGTAAPRASSTDATTPSTTASSQDSTPAAATSAALPGADKHAGGIGGRKTVALVVGGAGIVALGVGAYFGVSAISKNSDSSNNCMGNKCDPMGIATRNDAITAGNISTVLVGVGAAAVVAAGILWLTAPKAPSAAASARHVDVGIGPGSFLVKGEF